jgi:predicted dehydrogenase
LDLPIYSDYKEMFEKEKPDAVHICTPHYLHAQMAIYALDHGINVFLEKPACMTRSELAPLMEAEKRSSAILCVCFQNRFLTCVEKAREVLAEEKTGEILGARAFVTWKREGAYYTESPWRGKIATEGGSILINQSIHTLDLLLQFMGEPETVQGAIGNYMTPYNDTEDTAHIYMTFPGKKMGVFFATNGYCKSRKIELELTCENRLIRFVGDKLYVDDELYYEGQTGGNRGKAVWGKGHGILIERFYKALEEGAPSPVSLESASVSLKVLWDLFDQTRA